MARLPRLVVLAALLAATASAVPVPYSVIIEKLKTGSEQQQADALARLADIAATPLFDLSMVEACVPAVIQRLKIGSSLLKEKAAGLILNMATVPKNRELLLERFAVKPLVDVLRGGSRISTPAKTNAAGALQNLASDPKLRGPIAKVGGIPALIAATAYAPDQAHAALHNLAQHRDLKAIMLSKGYAPYGQTFDPRFDNPNGVRTIKRQVFFRNEEFTRPALARVVWRSTKHIVDENGRHTYQGGGP
eukprot:CAMPEP_0206038288 /NCGR_PEP_ID=MMETSP1466-20131121/4004_1 /ASSEMBLY_ACC=CAM_ASM_001126 /TAXON_ID=44452 /ORGANISM="Pavlova gyrans, Strain CCMP608" /LENGTH=247 /DNA_ID=CAMNT_0053412881 /DNA_START=106 /DNA_END=849 /DNA_ORIENTATION=+